MPTTNSIKAFLVLFIPLTCIATGLLWGVLVPGIDQQLAGDPPLPLLMYGMAVKASPFILGPLTAAGFTMLFHKQLKRSLSKTK